MSNQNTYRPVRHPDGGVYCEADECLAQGINSITPPDDKRRRVHLCDACAAVYGMGHRHGMAEAKRGTP